MHIKCSVLLYFVQAVVEDDPDYVVRRFESGRYAVDSECRRIYQRALELVEVRVHVTNRGEGRSE